MKYTKPSRKDGGWNCEQEADEGFEEGTYEYGPVEIFKERGANDHLPHSRRPICTIQTPDLDGEESECAGNMAMILWAPEMYETLKTVVALKIPHICTNAPEGFEDQVALSCVRCRADLVIKNIERQAVDFLESAGIEK